MPAEPQVALTGTTPHDGKMSELTCPKCHGAMRTYERNRVHIEQCTECRGIFLDRGELEQLMAAEAAWQAAPAAPPTAPPPPPQQYGQPAYGQPAYGQKPYYKRKKSFLEELFD